MRVGARSAVRAQGLRLRAMFADRRDRLRPWLCSSCVSECGWGVCGLRKTLVVMPMLVSNVGVFGVPECADIVAIVSFARD